VNRLITVALLAGTLTLTAAPARAASCGRVVGPFHQTNAQIWQADGSRYVPAGVTVSGLERPDWRNFTASDAAEISAAAAAWCANTVRLQVSEQHITDPALRDALGQEVSAAESLGLVVVINDNDEWDSPDTPMPTARTKAFWKIVAPRYAHDPQVVFDIFNEPRSHPGWACWHDGGQACVTAKGWHGIVGMSPLAKYVRGLAPNLMWIDGPGTQLDRVTRSNGVPVTGSVSSSLSAVKHWPIWGVRPMMYSIHHPNGPHTIANWRAKFGWIAEQRYAPVVNGEWSQFAAARGECWADAPQRAPAYLTYLRGLHVGMTIWKIGKWTEPGTTQGVHTTTDPAVPTGFGVWADWRCVNGYHHSAGQRIRASFQLINGG
jgi:Cellulase (glycosyl hydrolase family 5)